MKITCCKELHFSSGHRVLGHESKCAHLHGHNYKVELHAELNDVAGLDGIGRVVDFSVLKEKIGAWIDKYWDHGFIIHRDDVAADGAIKFFDKEMGGGFFQKLHRMPTNPTAENMAAYLGETVGPACLAGTNVRLVKVVVHETYSCSAEWTLE